MSKQSFKAPHRHAIWEAHGYKCFYCHHPLFWDDLEIDHVIPEHLTDKSQERAEVFTKYGLPEDWDITADHNLVPSCHSCNGTKSDLLSNRNQVIILLTQVSHKVSLVENLRRKYERQSKSDVYSAKLEAALASGALTEEQVRNALSVGAAGQQSPVQLSVGLEFLENLVFTELSADEVNSLLDMPLRLGTDLPDGLRLVRSIHDECYVRTCREYRDAIANGFDAGTNFELKMKGFFVKTLGVLEALLACRPAVKSYIKSPRIGLCDIDHLPSSLLPFLGDSGAPAHELIRTYRTVGALVAHGKAHIWAVSSESIEIDFEAMRIYFREVLRADLDGDGIEDVLVSGYVRAIGGTLGYAVSPFALTRRDQFGQLCKSEIIPSPGLADDVTHSILQA